MGYDLTDRADEDRILFVNAWNWRPTVEIVRRAGLLDAPRLEGLVQQCSATLVLADEARAIARHLREAVLPSLSTDARIRLDGRVTDEPDDGTLYRRPDEFDRNYGATRTWLESFAAFCEASDGFELN